MYTLNGQTAYVDLNASTALIVRLRNEGYLIVFVKGALK